MPPTPPLPAGPLDLAPRAGFAAAVRRGGGEGGGGGGGGDGAAAAVLSAGDVLLSVNGVAVDTPAALGEALLGLAGHQVAAAACWEWSGTE